MPRTPKRPPYDPEVAAAIEAMRAERQTHINALAARDAATPPWLMALRGYITAVVEHHLAMQEVGGDGHHTSDMAGEEQCEELWAQVVERFPQEPRITVDDFRVLLEVEREAQEIGKRDEGRREQPRLNDEKDT